MSIAAIAPAIEPGIRQGMSRAEYEAIPAVNQSLLKHYRRSAAHARVQMLSPHEPSESQELGTAIHCAILEPSRFAEEYVVSPKFDRRTTKGKQDAADFENANIGKCRIDADDYATCQGIAEAIAASDTASWMLTTPGRQELGAVWIDPDTGLSCKALIDRITSHAGSTVVIDLKSTKDASPNAFARDVLNYGYHVQAAFYLDGLNVLGPASRRFVVIAVEKEPPYGVAVYELDDEWIDLGRDAYRDYLRKHAACLASGHWPGYSDAIIPISPPRWAKRREEFDVV